jgi:predicted transcriptional regulator of viral defense system
VNPIEIHKKLKEKNIHIFTPLEFKRVFKITDEQSFNFLKYYTKKGLFERLKNGIYTLATDVPSELLIANKLYQPSYISFEFALSFHHVIPEMVYTITSATTKPTRFLEALGKSYKYYRIKKQAYLGCEPKKIKDAVVLIAEPEKALVDYLYFVALKKKDVLDRLSVRNLDKSKILKYAKYFNKTQLNELLGDLL